MYFGIFFCTLLTSFLNFQKLKKFSQFLQLLQALLGFMTDSVDVLDLFEVARKLTQCFCDQMYMLGANGRGNKVCTFEASGQGREAVRKRFDLSKCVHCNRVKPITAKGNNFLSQQQRQNHGHADAVLG